ncbi:hypothetical protein [Rhizobium sp. L1K21]|uniref:hypothetical protein n=1 Tax=Rhizobium sp. L1K21 TaxID=2954933 RepID=UPI002091EB61|nr:hypothetical protein [Rhizobium sp. L1K21]MCO6186908.1 hypothetical protein [Rhizobium sp. L1K21]
MQFSKYTKHGAMMIALVAATSPALVASAGSAFAASEKVKTFILPANKTKIPLPEPRPIRFNDNNPRAIDRSLDAEPRGVVGMVSTVYAQALISNLSGGEGSPTLTEVRQTLKAAADEPLTISMIKEINMELAENNKELALLISEYDGGQDGLAEDIYRARGKTSA